jgi:hypothetical protein
MGTDVRRSGRQDDGLVKVLRELIMMNGGSRICFVKRQNKEEHSWLVSSVASRYPCYDPYQK